MIWSSTIATPVELARSPNAAKPAITPGLRLDRSSVVVATKSPAVIEWPIVAPIKFVPCTGNAVNRTFPLLTEAGGSSLTGQFQPGFNLDPEKVSANFN